MPEASSPAILRLDGDALVHNWQSMARRSGSAATGAAVKADGYGLGAREVVLRLAQAGCRDFFVAHWAEAASIADLVPPAQIAVLNGAGDGDIALAKAMGAIPVLNTPAQIAAWKAGGGGRCHVMFDSGINRLGIGAEQFGPELFDGLDIDILASHLASADEDVPQNGIQLARFGDIAAKTKSRRRSLANSAGILLGPDYHFDLTRPGLSLYGGIARPEMTDFIKPVVQVSARVQQIRQLAAGEGVGYNAAHVCQAPTRVATLAIGYADGYLRGFSGNGAAFFQEQRLQVIGRVSMDLITVDAAAAPDLVEGDWVNIDYDLVAASGQSGMSQYELLTVLGKRFDRHWT